MSLINETGADSNRIRVKFYPKKLPGLKGAYFAFTANENVLDIEQVCASLRQRDGFTGNYRDLILNVKRFLDEAAYQLYDGYAVNMGYFSIHPPME